ARSLHLVPDADEVAAEEPADVGLVVDHQNATRRMGSRCGDQRSIVLYIVCQSSVRHCRGFSGKVHHSTSREQATLRSTLPPLRITPTLPPIARSGCAR